MDVSNLSTLGWSQASGKRHDSSTLLFASLLDDETFSLSRPLTDACLSPLHIFPPSPIPSPRSIREEQQSEAAASTGLLEIFYLYPLMI